MKKLTILLVFLLGFVGCASTRGTLPQKFGENPDVFCNLIQEPDPLLMGTWKGRFVRIKGRTTPDSNYVKYRLTKHGDKYALYFSRRWRSGKKRLAEWKNWTINGQEIAGEPQFGTRIFVEGSDVYFIMRGINKPVKMSRVED